MIGSDPAFRTAAPLIDGRPADAPAWIDYQDPFRGDLVARVARSDRSVVDAAVAAAAAHQTEVAALPVAERAAILRRAADIVERRADELATTITRQIGKAVRNTRREVGRTPWTLRASAAAAEALHGEVIPTTLATGGEGLIALSQRVPVGVVGAITPFNAPFNLVAHKLGPAFAAGNAVVVKPASQAALSALDLVAILEEAGAPRGWASVVPGDRTTVAALVEHPDVALFTLTGSRAAGEAVTRGAGARRVLLELGGNSPNIVHGDADLALAVRECASGGFSNTGQSCNSVQRIYVHESIAPGFMSALVETAAALRVGDPLDPATDVGTLVDEEAARRVEAWIDEARHDGARVLCGGARNGATVTPTVITDVRDDARVVCEEVFGPLVVVLPYRELDEAIERANASAYGLQAAVFTTSLGVAFHVAERVQAGGVLVNRSTNFRLDHLPYGGVKGSGIGREGPAFAAEEMTTLKLTLIDPGVPPAQG